MKAVLNKNKVSIVVADSGLGGLSICADLAKNLEQRRYFQSAAITYFNAQPERDRGYNLLPTTAEKIRVFDRALSGMGRFNPDAILLACNTLSVLYARTAFSRNASAPVIDIIDFGVRLIAEHLVARPDSRVIIFGTPTTIEAGAHASRLIASGFAADRIITQPCDRLAGEIEKDPRSAAVRTMVDSCVSQAAARLGDRRKPVFAALCCTHYGYSRAVFLQALRRRVPGAVAVLNPNSAMGACIVGANRAESGPPAQVAVNVVSKIILSDAKIVSIAKAVEPVSPAAANALRSYRHDPALFSFET